MAGANTRMAPDLQGQKFEDTFAELLEALLGQDLGYELLQLSPQPRGTQFGKDLLAVWRTPEGEERRWHFECKSHDRRTLPTSEVADKLLSVGASDLEIDVWCLALCHAEPAADYAEAVASMSRKHGFAFGTAVLSPCQMFIKQLYACHPQICRRQYGTVPSLTRGERERVIRRFGDWLERESRRSRERAPSGWDRITRSTLAAHADDDGMARKYLRGLTAQCPWAAVVHGWAVARPSAEEPLLDVVRGSGPGVAYYWLVGAGGEGKSTVLRRVARQLVIDDQETVVLWANSEAATAVPVQWLKSVHQGARIVLFVDDSRRFEGPKFLAEDDFWEQSGTTVVVVLADRSAQWKRRRRDVLPPRHGTRAKPLGPLSLDERAALVERLRERNLVSRLDASEVRSRIDDAAEGLRDDLRRGRAERPWLVPTILRLTDPADRPFELILRSVLTDLCDGDETDALHSLLLIALAHAGGSALPRDLAERIVGGPAKWVEVYETLTEELEDQLGSPFAGPGGSASEEYRTHGAAVSIGLVQAAGSDDLLNRHFSVACRSLVVSVRPEYSEADLLRDDRFDLLDRSEHYLVGEARLPHQAAAMLEEWVGLDTGRGFPAMQRLGTACSRWLAAAGRSPSAETDQLWRILERGRQAFTDALNVARRVLSHDARPHRYEGYDVETTTSYIYVAWAVLELTAANAKHPELRGFSRPWRSLYLAVVSFIDNDRQRLKSLSVVGSCLVVLGCHESAAIAFAVVEQWSSEDRRVARARRTLRERGVELPPVTRDSVSELISTVHHSLREHVSEIGVEASDEAHLAALDDACRRLERHVAGRAGTGR